MGHVLGYIPIASDTANGTVHSAVRYPAYATLTNYTVVHGHLWTLITPTQ